MKNKRFNFPKLWQSYPQALLVGTLFCFVVATLSNVAFEWAAILTSKYWYTQKRLPSRVLGQGSVGVSTIVRYAERSMVKSESNVILLGDSVMSSNHGAAYPGYPAGDEMFHHQVPHSLLVAQEGWEPGDLAFIAERLLSIPVIFEKKPKLIITYDFKYFLSWAPFTPSMTTQAALCQNAPFAIPQEIRAGLCAYWSHFWPSTYRLLNQKTPLLADSIQSQIDLAATFFQKLDLYGLGNARLGQTPFRTFFPGWFDAKRTNAEMLEFNKKNPFAYVAPHSTGGYLERVVKEFENQRHPKHLGTFALREILKRWPGEVHVLYFHPGPQALGRASAEVKAGLEKQEQAIKTELTKAPQVRFHPVREFLTEEWDFQDIEHPNIQGHRKMAQFINKILSPQNGTTSGENRLEYLPENNAQGGP